MIGVHALSVGASVGATLLILFLLLMIAACVHSCCFGGSCCSSFWSFIFSCCCGKCSHEDPGSGDGHWSDPRLSDTYFTKYYASSSATKYRWPDGKSALPYDTGYALDNVPQPVTVQCPDGTTRTLSMPDQVQNSITASPSPITGAGPPPHVNNGPESTAYPGTGSRCTSLARFGTISHSPSMPSLR